MIKFLFLILFSFISNSNKKCIEGKNFCILCELSTDLCKKCESDVFRPDSKGGCEGSKKCQPNENHCLKCSDISYKCETCDENFYQDDNGGCANIENCEISEKGNCKKCIPNYALVYKGKSYMECISMDTEELLNCEEYDIYGHCLKCKEKYYMNVGDKKCSNAPNCLYSTKGICDICDYDFYLDKKQEKCFSNNSTNNFWKCIFSDDGIKCNKCLSPYYLSENNFCVKSKFCKIGDEKMSLGKCSKCNESYFLTEDKFSCTVSNVCISGYEYNEKCKLCKDGYYNNIINGNCFSNQEDNDQKYCLIFSEQCDKCIDNYYLDEDFKCTYSENCAKSYLGNCTKCIEGYYLGRLDNKCTTVKNCIKSDFNYNCEECDDGYFLYAYEKCVNDTEMGGKYKNCKIVLSYDDKCSECKKGFYLDETNYLCYNNSKHDFHKCSRVILNSEGKKECASCEPPYYLGSEDLKCTLIKGCSKSNQNGDICLKCETGLCLNHIKNLCQINSYIDKEEGNEICYKCISTKSYEQKCNECEEGFTPSDKGYCLDESLCDKKEGGKCIQCKQNVKIEESLLSYCLNDQYGCMESVEGCLKCNDFYDPSICSQCFKGFYLDEDFNLCQECSEGCDSCTDYNDCGGCKEEGYYIIKEPSGEDTYDAECGKCNEGCRICSDDLDCEICYSGYFLNNKNYENRMKCTKCGVFCEECLDENYCLKCQDGYSLALKEDKVICEYKQINYTINDFINN